MPLILGLSWRRNSGLAVAEPVWELGSVRQAPSGVRPRVSPSVSMQSSVIRSKGVHNLYRVVAPGVRAPSAFCRRIISRSMALASAAGTAFIDPDLTIHGSGSGPLHGLKFALKDMYDVAGHRTGFGNPIWRETHEPATTTAPAVQALLDAGASIRGKTHMDELAYSLNGENYHYGTPENPAAPGRIPGGSSSGSASACAAGAADFALGSDTGGSIRIPGSYCGLFALRPTHGRISLDGACPLAPSFDTVGFFARDAWVLKAVGQVLLSSSAGKPQKLRRWLLGSDAFALAQASTSEVLRASLSARLAPLALQAADVDVAGGLSEQGLGNLADWFDTFRICQAWEIWQEHGQWVTANKPTFGPGIKDRFEMASGISKQARDESSEKRALIKAHLATLLGQDGILVIPTAPGPAPVIATPAQQLDAWRKSMISLTSIAGLAGLPQVTLPLSKVDGLPVGLSLLGPAGCDEQLLELAELLGAADK